MQPTDEEMAEQSERHERAAADRQQRAEERAASERKRGDDARAAGRDDVAHEHELAAQLHDQAAAFQSEHRRHSAEDAARHAAAAHGGEGQDEGGAIPSPPRSSEEPGPEGADPPGGS
ncbi:MAG: hypothetical protein JO367_19830 [Actinobacteria bacterium]|nr:hypothetical protein [Actinomycetota bacterium]